MAQPAQRFTFLDQQTNVAVANVSTQNTTDLLNSPQNDLKQLSSNLTDMLSTNIITPITAAMSNLGPSSIYSSLGAVRTTKDFFSSGINLTLTPQSILNNAAKDLAGVSPMLSNILSSLSQGCQNTILGGIAARRVQYPLSNCGNGSYGPPANFFGCNLNSIANALGNLSGGVYQPNLFNGFNLENTGSLIGMAGYKSALCGVFMAVTANMNNVDSVSRIASNLIGFNATRGDITSIIDIGLSLRNKGAVTGIIPGSSKMIMSHYTPPAFVKNSGLGLLHDKLSVAMTNIDPNWATDKHTNLATTKNLGGAAASNSKDINNLLLAGSSKYTVATSTTGNVVPMSNSAMLLAANMFKQTTALHNLKNQKLI